METIKKWSSTLITVVLLLMLMTNIVLICSGGMKLPLGMFVIRGDSMEPMLHRYDVVVTMKVPFSELEVSDVIVFERKGEYITHEIIAVKENSVITKGLSNGLADDPVSSEEYHAKMVFHIPYLGMLSLVYESAILLLTFIAVVAILVFGIRKK